MSEMKVHPEHAYLWIGGKDWYYAYIPKKNSETPNEKTPSYKWKIDDTSIVKQGEDGWFYGLKVGETKITAISDDGQYQASATVTVQDKTTATVTRFVFYDKDGSLGGDIEKFILGFGEKEVLTARAFSPYEGVLSKTLDINLGGVTWSSSDPNIATVVDVTNPESKTYYKGEITAGNTAGTAMIRVTSVTTPDVYKEFPVHVQPEVVHIKNFKIKPRSVEIAVGQTYQLEPTFTPADPTNKTVYWEVPQGARVTVGKKTGLVRGYFKGQTRVYGKTEDGSIQDYIIVNTTDGVNPVSKIETNYHCYRFYMSTARSKVLSNYSEVFIPTTPGQSASEVGVNVSIKDPSIIEVESIEVPKESSNRRLIRWNTLKPGYTTATLTSKTDPSKSTTIEIMVLKNSGNFDIYIPKTVFVVPETIEVERGQVFMMWARGFGGEHYNYYKGYTTETLGNRVFWNVEWVSNWVFTPNCSQLEFLRESEDTCQSYVWFRAGYIPGDYEIKVTRRAPEVRGEWPERTVKVKIVDKLFTDPYVELIPRKYYICFKDYDKMSYSDGVQCYTDNPCKFYIGWIKEATSSREHPTVLNADEFGWKILHDGIISKIEADGKYLNIYRGPNYGVTQVIFYLKSNPHIYYPCFVEYDGGDWRCYTTDKNLPTVVTTTTPAGSYSSATGNLYPSSNPLVDDQTEEGGESSETSSSSALPMVYKAATYNPKYNYKSDTGLVENKPIETKITKKISKGSFVDPDSKRGKNGSSLI